MSAQKSRKNPDFRHPETILVDDDADQVKCDGGGSALGHPLVWYSFVDDRAECRYCDRLFIKKRATRTAS